MNQVLSKLIARGSYTWNGAISNSTTGIGKFSSCLDYWTKAGTYTDRDQSAVDVDMGRIFSDDVQTALSIVFGLRLITRKPKVDGIEESQTGYGRRDEFYKAITWLHHNKPELLYRNLHLIPVFGSWKDLLQPPLCEVLEKNAVYSLVRDNLNDQLLRKYLPQIRSKGTVRTVRDKARSDWARGLCEFLGISTREYRKLKSSGAAHVWQKQMQRQEWDSINFNGIPGKAMLLHVSQKGKKDRLTVFERHNQIERLKDWALAQNNIKFVGYPYELTKAAAKDSSLIQKIIYNKQWETMLEPMKGHKLGNVLCALDTSGSMGSQVMPGISAYDICVSMGLVFSSLNVGYFKDAVVAFDNESRLIKLTGDFVTRLNGIRSMETAWGSTNFQSVIDLLCSVRKNNPDIPREEYPETLLVVSDMQFNPVGGNTETNYEAAMRKLNSVGLEDMRIIWWFVNGTGTDFPSQMTDKGVYMIGGFDPVNIKALMGLSSSSPNKKDFVAEEKKEETPLDGMKNFLSQPIFGLLTVEN